MITLAPRGESCGGLPPSLRAAATFLHHPKFTYHTRLHTRHSYFSLLPVDNEYIEGDVVINQTPLSLSLGCPVKKKSPATSAAGACMGMLYRHAAPVTAAHHHHPYFLA